MKSISILVALLCSATWTVARADGPPSEGQSCYDVWSAADPCSFTKETEDCSPEGFVPYTELYFCASSSGSRYALVTFYAFLVLFYFRMMGTTADRFLRPSLEELALRLHVGPSIAGLTFLAFGNGAPDTFSGIAAIRTGSFDLAMGALTGAGTFVGMVVMGSCIFAAGGIHSLQSLVRDCGAYLIGVAIMFGITMHGEIRPWMAVLMLAYYACYVLISVGIHVVASMNGLVEVEDHGALNGHDNIIDKGQSHALLAAEGGKQAVNGSVGLLPRPPSALSNSNQSDDSTGHAPVPLKDLGKSPLRHFRSFAQLPLDEVNYDAVLDELSQDEALLLGENANSAYSRFHRIVELLDLPFDYIRRVTIPAPTAEVALHGDVLERVLTWAAIALFPVTMYIGSDNLGASVPIVGTDASIPLVIILLVAGSLFAGLVYVLAQYFTRLEWMNILLSTIGFATGAIWLNALAGELVSIVKFMGVAFDLNETLMGATIISW
eukprot:CAMPEP_0184659012 /NCGR_PEP_ID=MMETSP0308-20130426/27754_1 /TAXON_ID=38269 /ORGANISM="Gloeochaete witrockiana, Strain SAG 46.84" /LENGTH=492 /DNA_ID=CAMNT_0027098451 /DNA_START=92 /DNA_END=1567 /DNA_ORIENTATION=+